MADKIRQTKMITVSKLCDLLNSSEYDIEMPSSGVWTKKNVSMKIKNAGILPVRKGRGRTGNQYSTDDIIKLFGIGDEKTNIPEPRDTIKEADTALGAWGEYKKKIEERVAMAPSAKVEAEIEKIMTATYKDELDVIEKSKLLLSRAEVEATNGRILSALKHEIVQIVGKISAVAPELDRKKLVMIRDTINEALAKVADELGK